MPKGAQLFPAKVDVSSARPLMAAAHPARISFVKTMAVRNLAAILVWLADGQCERD